MRPIQFHSQAMLSQALRLAADAHHVAEIEGTATPDDWPEWYAAYIVNAGLATSFQCTRQTITLGKNDSE